MLNKADDSLFAYHLSVNTNPLTKIYQMGTCVKTNSVAFRLKDGCQCVAGASFSVGSTYMDGTIVLVRMVKVFIQQMSVA